MGEAKGRTVYGPERAEVLELRDWLHGRLLVWSRLWTRAPRHKRTTKIAEDTGLHTATVRKWRCAPVKSQEVTREVLHAWRENALRRKWRLYEELRLVSEHIAEMTDAIAIAEHDKRPFDRRRFPAEKPRKTRSESPARQIGRIRL